MTRLARHNCRIARAGDEFVTLAGMQNAHWGASTTVIGVAAEKRARPLRFLSTILAIERLTGRRSETVGRATAVLPSLSFGAL
jgi:hypothetical protein